MECLTKSEEDKERLAPRLVPFRCSTREQQVETFKTFSNPPSCYRSDSVTSWLLLRAKVAVDGGGK